MDKLITHARPGLDAPVIDIDPALSHFIQFLPDPAYARDLQGNVVLINAVMERYLDVSQLGRDGGVVSLLQNSQIVRAEDAVIRTGETKSKIEVTVSGSIGVMYIFELCCMPWHDGNGDPQGVIGILRDITESRRKEVELAESTNLMTLVLEHLPVRVFWKDRDLVYLGCNTIFANDMGFMRPEELIGHDDFHTNMTDEEAKMCRGDDFGVLETNTGRYGIEEVIQSEEGKSWIRVSKVPLHNTSGELVGVLGMYEDVGEQKTAQIELEHALQREKELNELKTRFISTVSHEYRNPLAIMQNSAEMLLLLQNRLSEEQRKGRLDIILNEIKRMTTLMEDVLFIGREELEDISRVYEAVDIEQIAEEVIHSIQEEDRARINPVFNGNPHPIIAVPLHLSQMLRNLLINALKYSEDSVDLIVNYGDDSLEMKVVDRGIGIPDEAQELVFNSFFRSENVGLIDGNGLGLYIVKRSVEMHGGEVALDSTVGHGTTFTVTIPNKHRSLADEPGNAPA